MSEKKPKKLVRCVSCGAAVERHEYKPFYKLCLVCFDAAQNSARVEYLTNPDKFNARPKDLGGVDA